VHLILSADVWCVRAAARPQVQQPGRLISTGVAKREMAKRPSAALVQLTVIGARR
jgi:hypothetical protein